MACCIYYLVESSQSDAEYADDFVYVRDSIPSILLPTNKSQEPEEALHVHKEYPSRRLSQRNRSYQTQSRKLESDKHITISYTL